MLGLKLNHVSKKGAQVDLWNMELITNYNKIWRHKEVILDIFLMELQCGFNEPWKKSPGHVVPDSLQEQFSFGKPPDRKKEGVSMLRGRQNGLYFADVISN